MKRPANMSLVCVHAETDEVHGDCLKEDCGCGCHVDQLAGQRLATGDLLTDNG